MQQIVELVLIADIGEYLATNLVDGDGTGKLDIFLRDRQRGRTEIVSVGLAGAPANDDSIPCGAANRLRQRDLQFVGGWLSDARA